MSDLLRVLSDSELLSRTRDLVALERAVTLRLLLHLNEIERRQLHLAQGYSSMFDYCTSGLGYSEPAAVRRIRTARCVAQFPEVYFLLKSNQVSLNSVARIARVLNSDNKDLLLTRICGRSQREVEAIRAEFEPRAATLDVVRQVVVRTEIALLAPASRSITFNSDGVPFQDDRPNVHDRRPELSDAPTQDASEKSDYRPRDGDFHPIESIERRVRFHFSTSEEFQEKLDKVKALAWHRLPANASLEDVFELVMDAFISRHDPIARRERRKQRAANAKTKARDGSVGASASVGARQIPVEIRDEVFARDGGRCTFVGRHGRRCESTVGLQIDHITPVALGGMSTIDNLRLLCARHNRFEAGRLVPPAPQKRPE